ncbi:hypothetical protein H5T87_07630 [bacterium]|nr:hypothetical protein [bacterium]
MAVLGVVLLFILVQNPKVKVKVVKEWRWAISGEDPLGKDDPLDILISPDNEKLVVVYNVMSKQGEIKCHVRILNLNGENKWKDIALPSKCFVGRVEWSPDSQKILLCGFKENTSNSLALLLNLREGTLRSIPQIFQFWYPVRLVSIDSAFSPYSNALVMPKELEEGKVALSIVELEGKTKRLIDSKEVESFFAPPGIVYICWDEKGNALWLGKEGKGVFKLSFSKRVLKKVYNFPSLQGQGTLPSWVSIEPHSGKLLIWKELIIKGAKPLEEAEYLLTIIDLKTGKRFYEDRLIHSFLQRGHSWPGSKHSEDKKAVWFWSSYSRAPLHLWIIEEKRVKKMSFELPIPSQEQVRDIQWKGGMLYVSTYNWGKGFEKPPPQKMVKLYKIALSYPLEDQRDCQANGLY